MTAEIWKRVPGQPLLWASNLGRVKSDLYEGLTPTGGKRTYQLLPTYGQKTQADKQGNYFRMIFRFRCKTYKVHQMVCRAFKGLPPDEGFLVLHLDDNGLNNAETNLQWGTQLENLNSGRFRDLMAERAEARARSRTGRFA